MAIFVLELLRSYCQMGYFLLDYYVLLIICFLRRQTNYGDFKVLHYQQTCFLVVGILVVATYCQ
jgi:hypothetical protein